MSRATTTTASCTRPRHSPSCTVHPHELGETPMDIQNIDGPIPAVYDGPEHGVVRPTIPQDRRPAPAEAESADEIMNSAQHHAPLRCPVCGTASRSSGAVMPSVPPILQRILAKPTADGEKLLESALSAFLDFGIKRTSMGEIARRAGISPATLYRRFESKNDLVEAVSVREAQRFVSDIDERVRVVDGTENQLVEIFVAFISAIASNALLMRLLRTEPDLILPRLTTQGGPILAVGRTYMAGKLRELHDIDEDYDADLVAEIMARLALSLALTPDGLIPLDDEVAGRDFARRTLLPMLGARHTETG